MVPIFLTIEGFPTEPRKVKVYIDSEKSLDWTLKNLRDRILPPHIHHWKIERFDDIAHFKCECGLEWEANRPSNDPLPPGVVEGITVDEINNLLGYGRVPS